MSALPSTGLQIRSLLSADGRLDVSLDDVPVVAPGPDEVVVRIEATPVNPSDLMTLIPTIDPAEARFGGTADRPRVTARLTPEATRMRARRFGLPLTAGLEGAGTVIATGANARALEGRTVAALSLGPGLFAQYQTIAAADCVALPPGVAPAQGAALFCNPLTALSMLETVRLEGHRALIHTAAASNLGRMLVRICREDGVPLVNIVRRPAQRELLAGLGATHICDSSAPSFHDDLVRAIEATGAGVAFDAIGGGTMAGRILAAMEEVAAARLPGYSPYGSFAPKQVHVYGHLDTTPLQLDQSGYGLVWAVAGWVMPAVMQQVGPERAGALRARVLGDVGGVFASSYGRTVSLAQALGREAMVGYHAQSTGAKYLIDPTL